YITKGPIKVYVQGPASEVESINRNNLKPFINLLGYSAGTYYLDIEADISKNIKLNDEPKVLLNLIPAT
ncbi:CdaR family protein, partial [Herbinix hemicellulosilytica]